MTTIEWTDESWNPLAGCSIVSAGCTHCYAMSMAHRLDKMGIAKYKGLTRESGGRRVWNGKIRLDEDALAIPVGWKKPRRVFVNSMSDLFHPDVPEAFIRKVWGIMALTPQHTYQILTKRPEYMSEILNNHGYPVLPNVWLGTSVENSTTRDRINVLRDIPAAVRFVSFEPLIGSVMGGNAWLASPRLDGIHWAIVGGESGAKDKVRPMAESWVDEIYDLCRAAGCAFFFKQWGSFGEDGVWRKKKLNGRIYKGQTWDEVPAIT